MIIPDDIFFSQQLGLCLIKVYALRSPKSPDFEVYQK